MIIQITANIYKKERKRCAKIHHHISFVTPLVHISPATLDTAVLTVTLCLI
jgi:hypothetical protein